MPKAPGAINTKYFAFPILFGVMPGALFGIALLISKIFSDGVPGAVETALMAYMVFVMFYAYPPAIVSHLFGYEILVSPSGSMISYPKTLASWTIIIVFYVAAGLVLNRLFKIKYIS